MNKIDISFTENEMHFLEKMIGRKMEKFKCESLLFSRNVYGVIVPTFEEIGAFAFSNFLRSMDYFGNVDDVALFKITPLPK